MKTILLKSIIGIALFVMPIITMSQTVVTGDAADGMVYDATVGTTNNPYTSDVGDASGAGINGIKVGSSDLGGGLTLINGILVFQLPERPVGQVVTAGELALDFAYKRDWVSGSFDLYGLPYSSSAALAADMHYDGAFLADQSGNTGLQDAFWTAPAGAAGYTVPGAVTSDASSLIADYLNAQYDAGAVAGDYVFLRLSPDETYQDNGNFVLVSSGDATEDAIKPKLTITYGEPVSTVESIVTGDAADGMV
ncbi:MAG: hypothetical protein ABFS32_14135, partial [Bacteroidota bacterium]